VLRMCEVFHENEERFWRMFLGLFYFSATVSHRKWKWNQNENKHTEWERRKEMTKLDTALLFSFQIFEKGRVGLCS
jgi:hypothetical protein